MNRPAAAVLLFGVPMLWAQPAQEKHVFEAASVKPAAADSRGTHWNSTKGRMDIGNMTLKDLVTVAYDVKSYQIEGGPKWVDADRFDIVAKLEKTGEPEPGNREGDDHLREALKLLLAERFHLTVEMDRKLMPGYSLLTAKGGIKVKAVEGRTGSSSKGSRGKLIAQGVSMERFASYLARLLDRPVIDATGVPGAFDFTLEWAPDESPGDAAGSTEKPALPSLYTAIQETLGVKLEAQKIPVPVVMIKGAEKPTEN